MNKRLLIDFCDGVAVVFFHHQGKEYCQAFNNRYDLWEFLQNSPKAIEARASTAERRKRINDIAAERNFSIVEAAKRLAEMEPGQVRFLSGLSKPTRPNYNKDFNIANIEF